MPLRLLHASAIGALALGLLAACGDTDDDGDAAETTMAPDGGGGDGATGEDGGGGESSLEFTAVDIDFERDEVAAAAGQLQVSLVNEGSIQHTWVVEDHEDELKLEVMQNGDTDEGTIELEAGEYMYYCDVPGHRDAGMEGTLTLE